MARTNNVMIITGASSGFGYELAKLAAASGYRIVVTARRAERLQELVNGIVAQGGKAVAVSGDITNDATQQQLVDTAVASYGRVDVLVNNAGVPLKKLFSEEAADDLKRQLETNVVSVATLTRRALPELIKSRGVVINVGSTAGHFSIPGWGLYFPTKVAVASISDTLRRELRPLGVRVVLIEPGPYRTEFGVNAGAESFGGGAPEQVAKLILRRSEHPRRLSVAPGWLRLVVSPAGILMLLLPDVVDAVLLAARKLQQRRAAGAASQQRETAS